VISTDSNGIGKASCRSTEEVNISDVIRKGIECGVVISGGGHAMAAGFSLEMAKINDFLEFLKSNITHEPGLPEIYVDCEVPLKCISIEFLKNISILEPFGAGNRHPKFIIPSVRITGTRIVGENHLAFSIADEKGNFIRGIAFRSLNSLLGKILQNETQTVSVLGTLAISSWNHQISFQLEDISR
jgi:single-stranded-DNA-specific exonuclease